MEKTIKNGLWSQSIKSAVVALLTSVIAILILSVLAKYLTFGVDVIPIINQIIKIVAVAVGVGFVVKGEKSLFKGILAGIFYSTLSLAMYLAMGGQLDFRHILLDLAQAVAVGSVVSILVSKRR